METALQETALQETALQETALQETDFSGSAVPGFKECIGLGSLGTNPNLP